MRSPRSLEYARQRVYDSFHVFQPVTTASSLFNSRQRILNSYVRRRNMRPNVRALGSLMLLLLAVVSSCPAQTASDEETTFFDKWIKLRATDFIVSAMAGVDSEIESLRAGIRADKPHLLAEAMNFTESESKIFWPVYRKYEGDLTSINYQRVALNREYALKNNSLTDREAK